MTHNRYTEQQLQEMYSTALSSHQNEDYEKAISFYTELTSLFPEISELQYNLAHCYLEIEEYAKAVKHLLIFTELSPDSHEVYSLLGYCEKCSQNIENSIQYYLKYLESFPDDIDILYNLGNCYKDSHSYQNAITFYKKGLEHNSSHLSIISNLAYVLHKTGNEEEACIYFQKLLTLAPDNSSARHMVTALTETESETAPPEYVMNVFDSYASNYEESLVKELEYKVPQQLLDIFKTLYSSDFSAEHMLDLGCGSGLAAEKFNFCTKIITGIDLSSEMLAIAADKDIYTNIFQVDILDFLQQDSTSYDLVIAADVFTYIGDLSEIFSTLSRRVKKNTPFIFSTELADSNYLLKKSGRFGHAENYIDECAAAAEWKIVKHTFVNLRKERGKWIQGQLHFLERL